MGNDQSCPIVGRGTVVLELPNKTTLQLNDVRHVPGVRLNLLSTSALDDEGYISRLSGRKWRLSKGALIITQGRKEASLYSVFARTSGCTMVAKVDEEELWHRRLGHLSESGM